MITLNDYISLVILQSLQLLFPSFTSRSTSLSIRKKLANFKKFFVIPTIKIFNYYFYHYLYNQHHFIQIYLPKLFHHFCNSPFVLNPFAAIISNPSWNFRFLSIQLAITLRQERTKGRKREANVAKRKIARLLRNKGGYVAFSRYLTSRIRFTYRPDTDDPTATPDTTAYGMQRALLERCRFVEVERGISSLPRSRSDHDSARTRTRGRRLEEESRIMPTLLPATAPFANPWIFERMPILVDRAHICLFDRFWSGWIDGSI